MAPIAPPGSSPDQSRYEERTGSWEYLSTPQPCLHGANWIQCISRAFLGTLFLGDAKRSVLMTGQLCIVTLHISQDSLRNFSKRSSSLVEVLPFIQYTHTQTEQDMACLHSSEYLKGKSAPMYIPQNEVVLAQKTYQSKNTLQAY